MVRVASVGAAVFLIANTDLKLCPAKIIEYKAEKENRALQQGIANLLWFSGCSNKSSSLLFYVFILGQNFLYPLPMAKKFTSPQTTTWMLRVRVEEFLFLKIAMCLWRSWRYSCRYSRRWWDPSLPHWFCLWENNFCYFIFKLHLLKSVWDVFIVSSVIYSLSE